MYTRLGPSGGKLGSFELHALNPALGGFEGFFSKILSRTGKQTMRASEQAAELESRASAISRAIRGKKDYAPPPGPTGPTPEEIRLQAEKEAAMEAERQALLEKEAELTAKLEQASAESAAAQERAREELQILQQQMEQQRAEQQAFQQQLMMQLQQERAKSPMIPIILGVVVLGTIGLIAIVKK